MLADLQGQANMPVGPDLLRQLAEGDAADKLQERVELFGAGVALAVGVIRSNNLP